MKRKLTFRTMVWTVVAAIALLSLSGGVDAVQGDKKIRMYDDCEPTSFNAVLGDGTCIGNGHTTFDEFIAELAETQDAHEWRNQPSAMQVRRMWAANQTLRSRRGSTYLYSSRCLWWRLHSRSQWDLRESGSRAGVFELWIDRVHPAGATEEGPTAGSSDLPVGTHRFQCCIHPWMRTVIEVAAPGSGGAPAPTAAASHHGHH